MQVPEASQCVGISNAHGLESVVVQYVAVMSSFHSILFTWGVFTIVYVSVYARNARLSDGELRGIWFKHHTFFLFFLLQFSYAIESYIHL